MKTVTMCKALGAVQGLPRRDTHHRPPAAPFPFSGPDAPSRGPRESQDVRATARVWLSLQQPFLLLGSGGPLPGRVTAAPTWSCPHSDLEHLSQDGGSICPPQRSRSAEPCSWCSPPRCCERPSQARAPAGDESLSAPHPVTGSGGIRRM